MTKVMKEQLEPVVREALTEDVLRAVQEMLGLTPLAVSALHEDLQSSDVTVRQRAYSLLIKYTVGHKALISTDDLDDNKQLIVNFNLPRPSEEDVVATDLEASEIQESQVCDVCNQEKPSDQFEAGSSRCQQCHESRKAAILEMYA